MINLGDDVTISGKVICIERQRDMFGWRETMTVRTPYGTEFKVTKADIKTHRPNTKEGE